MTDLILSRDDNGSEVSPLESIPIPRVLPRIKICGDSLWCENRFLSLERRPLTKKLFEAFLVAPEKPLNRDELVAFIYGECFRQGRTDRYRQALSQNIVKLISRGRQLAEEAFCGKNIWMEWFCYNADRETWSLFRLSHQFLQEKERLWH